MKDGRFDLTVSGENFAIGYASLNGHLDVVKELMKDDNVDPSADDNFSIKNAYENGYFDVVDELLKDDRVLNKLGNEKKIL